MRRVLSYRRDRRGGGNGSLVLQWNSLLKSVARSTHEVCTALELRCCKAGRDFIEHREMLVDVGFRVLDGDGPLLVPPVGLRQDAAVNHREPVVAPKIDVDIGPIAIIANFLRVEHQRAVDSSTYHVGLKPGLLDDSAIAFRELRAE